MKEERVPEAHIPTAQVKPHGRAKRIWIVLGILGLMVVYGLYVMFFVKQERGISDIFRILNEQGYTANIGLSGIYRPGNVIQVMEGGRVQIMVAVSLAVAWVLMAVFHQSWASSSTQIHESTRNKSAGANRLRGFFLGQEKSERGNEVVGRVSILLIEGGRSHQVGIDHIFRSGDKFRFEITSNRDGWLSILHRSPGGDLQLLWPKPNGDITASNHVRAKARYVVPPSPGLFVFDDEVGKESFYVAIEAEPRAQGAPPEHDGPELSKSSGADTIPPPRKKTSSAEQRIINFKVRGGDAVGLARRGVVFDPGSEEYDPNVYFTASKEDDGTIAVLEFQLRHDK